MKTSRQMAIIEIITKHSIYTQSELVDELNSRGFSVAQATVSRDIKELKLTKMISKNGMYAYAMPDVSAHSHKERLVRLLSETVLSIDTAYNQIVIKTISGSANMAAEALDSMDFPEIIGTIAGDNTILLIVKSVEEVQAVVDQLNKLM